MASRSNQAQLTQEVVRFGESVRATAIAIARTIFRQELLNRLDDLKRSVIAPKSSRRVRRTPKPNAPRPTTTPTVDATSPPRGDQKTRGKRAWTRDAIITELAMWMVSGTTIDAAFVTRHGPPGLVAATRKVFGRFDAALNVASLRVSKMYPDGPPTRRSPRG